MDDGRLILYFDGVCNLCDRLVLFFIKHDRKKRLLFASLQSAAGANALKNFGQKNATTDTVLLYKKGRYYMKSSAIIHALMALGGLWKISVIAWIIPAFLRNKIYDLVAKNRYRWFGKKEKCVMPATELQARFLQD